MLFFSSYGSSIYRLVSNIYILIYIFRKPNALQCAWIVNVTQLPYGLTISNLSTTRFDYYTAIRKNYRAGMVKISRLSLKLIGISKISCCIVKMSLILKTNSKYHNKSLEKVDPSQGYHNFNGNFYCPFRALNYFYGKFLSVYLF